MEKRRKEEEMEERREEKSSWGETRLEKRKKQVNTYDWTNFFQYLHTLTL